MCHVELGYVGLGGRLRRLLPLKLLRSLYFTMVQTHLTYGVILWGSTYQCHLKQLSILQTKAIRCINKAHYNTHTEPLVIRSKILKLDDIYKFELSKFMFDCINGQLPIPIFDYFTTNATIHTHHTRQMTIPHVTQTYGTISQRTKYHRQSNHNYTNKKLFTRVLKTDYITKYN